MSTIRPTHALLLLFCLGCGPEASRFGPEPGVPPGRGGSGPTGGSPSARLPDGASPPSALPDAASEGARPDAVPLDTRGFPDASRIDMGTSGDTAPVHEAGADTGGASGRDGGRLVSTQGPMAEGTIVYSQDFEANMAGMSPSPTSLPASRYALVDDPLGQRGKVLRLIWQSGDNYRTSPNNKPRSCISNRGYEFPYGSKVSYAWGYMVTSVDINATFAQHIRPGGPMWMLEGHNQGELIVRCGGTTALGKRLVPNRWYDFRVEVDYRRDGYVQVHIDGEKVYERRDNLGFEGAKTGDAHWDGGIYNTELGIANGRTRTVYISNLSIGRK
jgi:hypothetical protein